MSQCMPTVGLFHFGLFTPSITLPYPFTSHPPSAFSTHPCVLYLHMLCYVITDALSLSFPFPLSPSSIESFHYYKHVLHLSLYVIMLVFVCMFIFWICLPSVRENSNVLFSPSHAQHSPKKRVSTCSHRPHFQAHTSRPS
jgi:hypothetical protein